MRVSFSLAHSLLLRAFVLAFLLTHRNATTSHNVLQHKCQYFIPPKRWGPSFSSQACRVTSIVTSIEITCYQEILKIKIHLEGLMLCRPKQPDASTAIWCNHVIHSCHNDHAVFLLSKKKGLAQWTNCSVSVVSVTSVILYVFVRALKKTRPAVEMLAPATPRVQEFFIFMSLLRPSSSCNDSMLNHCFELSFVREFASEEKKQWTFF